MSNFYDSFINLGLPNAPPDAFKHPEARAAVEMLIQTAQNLLRAIEQATGFTTKPSDEWASLSPQETLIRQNGGRLYIIASEDMTFGTFVNIWNNAGIPSVRKAVSTGNPAHGYCNVSSILAGAFCEVVLSQGILAVAGINAGDSLYLSPTAGLAGLVPDTGAGRIEQFLGIGVGAGIAYIDISLGQYIQH